MEYPLPDLIVDNVAPFPNNVIQTARFVDSEWSGLLLCIPFIYGTRYFGNFSYSIGRDNTIGLPLIKEGVQYVTRQRFADSIIYIDNVRFDLGYGQKYQENITEGFLEGLSLIALYGEVYEQYVRQTDKNAILTMYLNNQLRLIAEELEEVEAKAQELYSKQKFIRSYLPRI